MKRKSAVLFVLLIAIVCLMSVCICACSNGNDGSNGKSAYEIWLEEGHTGSQSDFLAWLKGDNGDDGTNGANGNDGKSAYQIWLDNGFEGTEMDFLNWLKGDGGTSDEGSDDKVSGDGSESNPWLIAENISAWLTQNGENYTLIISGNGNMQNWSSAESAPWYSSGAKINEICIGNEVKSIGDYAFSNVAVSSLVIHENVESVGGYALPSQSVAYIYPQTTVATNQNNGAVVSVYSESVPATHDRHWTSWGSSGNITDEPFNAEVQYWHYDENDEIVAWDKIKVLFIGNSFTFYYQMPLQFDAVAENLGYYVETYSIAVPGQTLETHAVTTSNSGTQITALLNAVNDFDYIVLQEQSTRPYTAYEAFFNAVQKLKTQINATQDHAKIYLYETWGSPASAGNSYEEIAEMEQKLYEAYTSAANELQLNVTYVGRAFTYIKGETNLNLYYGDNRHPGPVGSHLSACVHVASMLGGDVRNSTLTGNDLSVIPCEGGSPQKMNLSEEQCSIIRAAAYKTVFESGDEKQTYTLKLWYDGTLKDELTLTVGFGAVLPACEVADGEKFAGWTLQGDDKIYAANTRISYAELSEYIDNGVVDLCAKSYQTVIAVWGRWISEDNFKLVMQGFKTYCEENSLQYDKVGYIYYVGKTQNVDPYFMIADFTTKANQDDADIIFPCGDNIKNAAQSNVANKVVEFEKLEGVSIEGNNTRYVARLNDNALTQAFYNYVLTDAAKAILNGLS